MAPQNPERRKRNAKLKEEASMRNEEVEEYQRHKEEDAKSTAWILWCLLAILVVGAMIRACTS